MKPTPTAVAILVAAALASAGGSYILARNATRMFEKLTRVSIERSLHAAGYSWVEVNTDGTWVDLSGTATNPVTQDRAISIVQKIVSPKRIIDRTTVEGSANAQMKRAELVLMPYADGSGITMTGEIPESLRAPIVQSLRTAGFGKVEDLLILRKAAPMAGWDTHLDVVYQLARLLEVGSVTLKSDGAVSVKLPYAQTLDTGFIAALNAVAGDTPFEVEATGKPVEQPAQPIDSIDAPTDTATATAEDTPEIAQAPKASVIAYRLSDGHLHIRSRISDVGARIGNSYATALFGADVTFTAEPDIALTDTSLILTALDLMQMIDTGYITLGPDEARISGASRLDDIEDAVTRLLDERLPENTERTLTLRVVKPAVQDSAADRDQCNARLSQTLANETINFAPSSAVISEDSAVVLDRIAEIMRSCEGLVFEVAGHTDDKGSEAINRAISQARADSVVDALLARGVFLTQMVARGYGESTPIADNETEEGRELNRRIEIQAEPEAPNP